MTIYTATIEGDSLVCGDIQYRGTDQVGKLCRELKQGALHVYRDSKISMTVDVFKRAALTLSENDKSGLRYVKYKPFPTAWLKEKVGK